VVDLFRANVHAVRNVHCKNVVLWCAEAFQYASSQHTIPVRKQPPLQQSFSELRELGVRVYVAEQAPVVHEHDIVPENYAAYLQQETQKQLEAAAKISDALSTGQGGQAGRCAAEDESEPRGASGSLGWAALWKVAKVLTLLHLCVPLS
jgi:hypothetical protein